MKLPRHFDQVIIDITNVEAMHDFAIDWIIERRKRLREIGAPIVAIKTPTTVQFVELSWNSQFEKEMQFGLMRHFIKTEISINLYSFMTEAWAAALDKEKWKDVPIENIPAPSKMPENERDDVLFITTHQRGGKNFATQFVVGKRGTLGVRNDLYVSDGKDGLDLEGPAFNWFK